MLSNEDLDYMREAIEDLLPDTCDILQVTQTPDGFGGVSQTWGTAAAGTAVPCRLDIVSNGSPESVAGASVRAYQETVLSMPYNIVVSTTNRIKHEGTTYAVQAVNTGQSWIAVKRCKLERVE
jgi:hypothetical protein